MTLYSLALFVHILGALALFGAMGLEWVALLNLRRVEMAEQAREWLKVFALFPRIYPLAWLAIILAGLCMTAAVWKGAGWIIVALVSVVVLAAAGGALTSRRIGFHLGDRLPDGRQARPGGIAAGYGGGDRSGVALDPAAARRVAVAGGDAGARLSRRQGGGRNGWPATQSR